MTPDAWITAAVVVGVLAALARDLAPPPFVVIGAVVVLLLADVITAEEALAGFSNPAPITVAALYVVARAVQRTGLVSAGVDGMLGSGDRTRSQREVLSRLVGPTMASSALLNNTPIVAVLAPGVANWADSRGIPASRLLIPLSYAAILGGTLTVVGTSTTLVVSGLMQQAGMTPIGLLEPVGLALPVVLVGALVIVALAPVVLPVRRAAHEAFRTGQKSFTLSVTVLHGGAVDGMSLGQAGLRALRGVYCVQVRRGTRVIAPVSPEQELRGGDELTFVGDVHRVVDLQHRRGLALAEAHHAHGLGSNAQGFYEAVIGPSSPLVGSTLKEAGFRATYGAAVVAIHRAGEPLADKLGEVPLRVGDTLLCIGSADFPRRSQAQGAFVLVAAIGADAPLDQRRRRLVLAILAGMLGLAGFGVLSILEAALAAAIALVATRVLTPAQARLAVDAPVIVVIASAFGLGAAVERSGLAEVVADVVTTAAGPFGNAGLVVGLLVLVVVLTETVTNNAAAVLAFPVAQAVAVQGGLSARPLLIGMAIAASLSFLTPLGYQTNLMVYGLGGYHFGDFARLGASLTLAVLVALSGGVLLAV